MEKKAFKLLQKTIDQFFLELQWNTTAKIEEEENGEETNDDAESGDAEAGPASVNVAYNDYKTNGWKQVQRKVVPDPVDIKELSLGKLMQQIDTK